MSFGDDLYEMVWGFKRPHRLLVYRKIVLWWYSLWYADITNQIRNPAEFNYCAEKGWI